MAASKGVGSLEKYWKKRDFGKTPEPSGKAGADGAPGAPPRGARKTRASRTPAPKPSSLGFVIQKHAATRLHYDFRLELDGVLKSWAVPKGPSLDPKERRLAVHVEDHPIAYADFEGVIPKGEYGGGPVLLWDRGTWTPEGDPRADYRRGRLSFRLDGEKLQGGWSLVRMQGRDEGGKENWLLLKADDAAAKTGPQAEIVERQPRSVETKRTIEQIAAAKDRTWHSNRPPRGGGERPVSSTSGAPRASRTPRGAAPDPSGVEGVRKGALPREIEPQLATLVDAAPPGEDWLHEIKLDGYRILARVEDGAARLSTRRGKDWTAHFPTTAGALGALPVRRALLDGELVSLDEKGRSSFQDFQNRLSEGREDDLVYYAFDLLHLDDHDLRGAPLLERKRLLQELLSPAAADARVRFSDHVVGRGPEVFEQACRLELEGIISKRAKAPYVAGRGRDWLKVKCARGQEFVIAGFTPPEGARSGIGALLVGVHEDGRLRYAGKVGTGFTDAALRELREKLGKLARAESPLVDPPSGYGFRGVTWVEPVLVAEVRFAEWTRDHRLRHPSFQGLRADKPASKVVRERPADEGGTSHVGEGGEDAEPRAPRKESPVAKTKTKATKTTDKAKTAKTARKVAAPDAPKAAPAPPSARAASKAATGPEIAGVRLSNPGRVLYPKDGLTKVDVARYYEAIAERILPWVEGRPLTLVRCPEGHEKECFFQKHAGMGTSDAVRRIRIPEHGKTAEGLMVDSAQGLVSLVQMGVLELHVWGSTVRALEQPDQIVMDLDPDPDLPWERMVEAARLLRARFRKLGFEPFVKTTGGKGLHVVVPLKPSAGWDEVKAFSKWVADSLTAEQPDRYLAVMTKAKRVGKIFVDYLRNGRGATAVAPYSTRARAGATVAAPISWEELGPDVAPGKRPFHVGNVPERAARKDPWARFDGARAPLTKTILKEAGIG